MLFDIGWPELLVIGVVALVVIGPKDLPRALRIAGYWVRKARNLSREFQSSIDQMIREAELEEVRQDLKKAADFNIEHEFQKTVDPDGSLAESIKPPDVPDHFEPPPSAAETAALAEPAPVLAAPAETALPDPPVAAEPAPAEPAAESAPGETAAAPPGEAILPPKP